MDNFPELTVGMLPYEDKELKAVRVSDPLLYFDTLRMRQMAEAVMGKTTQTAEKYFNRMVAKHLGTNGATNGLSILSSGLAMARNKIQANRSMIPDRYQPLFTSEGKVAFMSNFHELLVFWINIEKIAQESQSQMAIMREFEARQLIWLSILCAKTMARHIESAQEPGSKITDQLEEHFFDSDTPLVKKTVVSWHDPAYKERVRFWHFEEDVPPHDTTGLIRKLTVMFCRSVPGDTGTHLTFFESRKKDPEDEVRKSISKKILASGLAAPDKYGLRFVFFDRTALEEGLTRLLLNVWPMPFTTWKLSDNIDSHSHGGAQRNGSSSAHFRALKFQTLAYGHWPEVIIQPIEDYLNHASSRGAENHRVYRAQQALGPNGELNVLFPPEIFGVNWQDPEVHELVIQRALTSID